MATIDRIEPAYAPWSPSASGFTAADEDSYTGRHRQASGRVFSVRRLFHTARHRRR